LFLFFFIHSSLKDRSCFLPSIHQEGKSPILPKKASNIAKFFNVAEKSVLKPKSHMAQSESFFPLDNSKLDLSKPSTSTNTKSNVLKSGETPMVKITNFDVVMYRDMVKGMSSSEISNLIQNVFRPDKKYSFPKTSGRSFRYDWLELHLWLCYSPSQDGTFCLSCVLFGDRFPGKCSKIHNLFSQPLPRWSGAAYTLKHHAGQGLGGEISLYACTFPILTSLLSQMSGKAQPIEVILDTNL
jgi:hypothetical protein